MRQLLLANILKFTISVLERKFLETLCKCIYFIEF